ncbi:MAG: serine hydrolase domain-containing protein [Isosphaeraceae bacterium]
MPLLTPSFLPGRSAGLCAAILLGSALLVPSALAQNELPRSSAELVGVSSQRLRRIPEAIQRHIDEHHISGAVTLLARKGFVVHFQAQGLADLESSRPMTRETVFKMASSTKPVTGVAIMMLVEEGKVRLSDPVSRFIPEFKEMKVAVAKEGSSDIELVKAERELTIRDLLTHTSGLASGGPGTHKGSPETLWPKADDTLGSHVPHFAHLPLDFQPGSKWQYSGLAGIDTLARVVEIASRQSFDQFLQKRIFEPLGMTDTFFVVPEDRKDRTATIYRTGAKGLEHSDLTLNFPKTYFSGAGGLSSTAADYFRFGQMLLNRGTLDGHRLLAPRSVEVFSANHVGDFFTGQLGRPKGMGFGLTVEIVEDPVEAGTYRSAGSFGWDGAFGTHFWVDPESQVVGVLMIQTSVGRLVQRDFETAVMQAIVE